MLLLSTQVVEWLVCQGRAKNSACSGSEGPYKARYLNFVTIFVMLRPNPIYDLFTRMFTGVKGMLEGFQPFVGNSPKDPTVQRSEGCIMEHRGICQLHI